MSMPSAAQPLAPDTCRQIEEAHLGAAQLGGGAGGDVAPHHVSAMEAACNAGSRSAEKEQAARKRQVALICAISAGHNAAGTLACRGPALLVEPSLLTTQRTALGS